ncbi:MAG: cytochrome c3 family protein [Geobacter sp.]|nr:cytochrome c3 family protein [Geobacter sp.]
MKRTVFSFLILLLTPICSMAFECNVCHSKNPAMVKMHKAVKGRNCFDCHKIGEKLMGKAQPKDRDSLLKRRSTDPLCVECHASKAK